MPVAKLSREEIQQIVERDAPGSRLVERVPDEDRLARATTGAGAVYVDDETPDLLTLRRRYLGDPAPDDHGDAAGVELPVDGESNEDSNAVDDEIVLITPPGPADRWGRGPGPKSVVISGRERRIIGWQG